MNKKSEELAFRQGYFLAVANLIRLFGEGIEATELLGQFSPLTLAGIDEYDREILRPVVRELRRKARL